MFSKEAKGKRWNLMIVSRRTMEMLIWTLTIQAKGRRFRLHHPRNGQSKTRQSRHISVQVSGKIKSIL